LARLPELAGIRMVLGYAAMGTEVDIAQALLELQRRGVAVHLPWVADEGRLGVSQVDDLDEDLAPGWRGVLEPRPERRRPVRPDRLDAVIAPGVGFDADGNRLGYGGGHFDRLLSRLSRGAVVVGVAMDEQVVDRLPAAAHDRPVDVVVTPTSTLRPSR
jgi:5-formyltetrahydrofolate cyclo-ligase